MSELCDSDQYKSLGKCAFTIKYLQIQNGYYEESFQIDKKSQTKMSMNKAQC